MGKPENQQGRLNVADKVACSGEKLAELRFKLA
jgi:hypothetical protein